MRFIVGLIQTIGNLFKGHYTGVQLHLQRLCKSWECIVLALSKRFWQPSRASVTGLSCLLISNFSGRLLFISSTIYPVVYYPFLLYILLLFIVFILYTYYFIFVYMPFYTYYLPSCLYMSLYFVLLYYVFIYIVVFKTFVFLFVH